MRNFSVGPVVKIPSSNVGGMGSISGQGTKLLIVAECGHILKKQQQQCYEVGMATQTDKWKTEPQKDQAITHLRLCKYSAVAPGFELR